LVVVVVVVALLLLGTSLFSAVVAAATAAAAAAAATGGGSSSSTSSSTSISGGTNISSGTHHESNEARDPIGDSSDGAKGNGQDVTNDTHEQHTSSLSSSSSSISSGVRRMPDLKVLDLDLNFFGLAKSTTSASSASSDSMDKSDNDSDQGSDIGTDAAAANSDDASSTTTTEEEKQLHHQELPTLNEWRILSNGRVVGSVLNHTVFTNGDVVTTSAITHPENAADGRVVTTYSGSQYRLGTRLGGWKALVGTIGGGEELHLSDVAHGMPDIMHLPDVNIRDMLAHLPTKSRSSAPGLDTSGTDEAAAGAPAKAPAKRAKDERDDSGTSTTAKSNEETKAHQQQKQRKSESKSKQSKEPTLRERKRAAKVAYDLTGQTAGPKGRYLISGKPFRTTSGKSLIYSAYESNADGLPTEDLLALKVSTNCAALTREASNYDRIVGGGYGSRFVTKHDFLIKWNGPTFGSTACALVLEAGRQDLKSVMAARGSKGLDGPAMRDAAYAAALCVQAMHSVGLVWTDLKPENFIVTTNSIGHGSDGLEGVKGIDLESAIPVGENPVDYSPEACPPEFAESFHNGEALDHVLDYTYDIWSLGMLLYELSTGRSYFETETPDEITQILSNDFRADVRAVERNRLRNLIGKCLQRDPKKRPRIAEVLFHPYFLTTGMGWY